MQKGSKGFTLIELIIVIVILGILAVVAAPRFIDISTDARLAKLESLEANMRSAASLVYYNAEIEGITDCDLDPTVRMGDQDITLRCGYPCPHPSGITNTLLDDEGITWVGGNCAGRLGNIDARLTDAPDPENCKVRYAASDGNRPPLYQQFITGC